MATQKHQITGRKLVMHCTYNVFFPFTMSEIGLVKLYKPCTSHYVVCAPGRLCQKCPGCHTNVHNFQKVIAPPVLPRLQNKRAHDILQAFLSIVGSSKLFYSECWMRY